MEWYNSNGNNTSKNRHYDIFEEKKEEESDYMENCVFKSMNARCYDNDNV